LRSLGRDGDAVLNLDQNHRNTCCKPSQASEDQERDGREVAAVGRDAGVVWVIIRSWIRQNSDWRTHHLNSGEFSYRYGH